MSRRTLSKKKRSKKSGKKRWLAGVAILMVLAVSVTVFLLYENYRVYGECYVEAGVDVTVQDFLRRPVLQRAVM